MIYYCHFRFKRPEVAVEVLAVLIPHPLSATDSASPKWEVSRTPATSTLSTPSVPWLWTAARSGRGVQRLSDTAGSRPDPHARCARWRPLRGVNSPSRRNPSCVTAATTHRPIRLSRTTRRTSSFEWLTRFRNISQKKHLHCYVISARKLSHVCGQKRQLGMGWADIKKKQWNETV